MALGSTITQVTDSGLKPGITFPSFVSSGVATATNFKTGTTDVHSTGVTVATSVVGSAVTSNSTGIDVTGIITATSFTGSGANLTGVASTEYIHSSTNAVLSGIVTTGPLNSSTGNFSSNVTISGNLGVAGTITYEDVARVDATGISTFREGFGVGPLAGIALTAYKDGSIRTVGIITASTFGSDTNSIFTTGGTEKLRITSGGNVAIGNASPQQLLHVWPDTANTTSAYVRVTSGDRGSGTGIDLGSDADGDGRLNVVSNGNLKLYTNNAERLRIGASGQIGIAGANYGSSGQVITSGGSGAAVSWASASLSSESVQAEMVGDQSIGSGSWTLVRFNAQNWDTGNNYDHNTDQWCYQAPSNGKYWYKVNIRLNAIGSGKELDVILYKSTDNGSSYGQQVKSQRWIVSPNGGATTIETTGLMALNANDRIRAYAWHNHGSSRDLDDNWCLFEVFRLGD